MTLCGAGGLIAAITVLCTSPAFGRTGETKPLLIVQPSRYVDIINAEICILAESVRISNHFIVLGRGIYGHFDVVACDSTGTEILRMKSEDTVYRKNRGSRVKSFNMDLGRVPSCKKVEIAFHETRLDPHTGTCVSSGYPR